MFRNQDVTVIIAVLSLIAMTSTSGEVNFRYIPGKKDFLGALQSCIHLPEKWSLQSQLDSSNLHRLKIQMEANSVDKTWLGVRVKPLGEWLWVSGIQAPNFTADVSNGTCGVIGSVNSVPCHSKLPFICELTGSCPVHLIDRCSSTGNSVIFIGCNSHSWHSARAHCRELGGDLLVLSNDKKLEQILEIIKAKSCPMALKNFFIGIRSEDWITVEEWLHKSSENEKAIKHTTCITLDIDKRGHLSLVPENCNIGTHVICREAEYEHYTTINIETARPRKEDNLPNILLISLMIIPLAVLVLATVVWALMIYARKRRWQKIKRAMKENQISYRTETEEIQLANKNSINVVLIGTVGSGKSSLINSFIMAFGAKLYRDVALRGSFGGQFQNKSKTKALSPYMLSEKPVHSMVLKGETLSMLKGCHLTFWDMPGLPNENDAKTRRLIGNLLAGRTKSGDTTLKMMSTRLWISPCCEVNIRGSPICKPDLVIFVYAANKDPPTKLATALTEAINRELPIIVIMTHLDKLHKSWQGISQGEELKEPVQAKLHVPSQDTFEKEGSKEAVQEKLHVPSKDTSEKAGLKETVQEKLHAPSQDTSEKDNSKEAVQEKLHVPSQPLFEREASHPAAQEDKIKNDQTVDNITALLGIDKYQFFSVTSYCDAIGLEKKEHIEEKFQIIFNEIKKLLPTAETASLQETKEEEQELIGQKET